tara:strand:- start:315 stop:650 length:336 start_codon:yes stop_codon:yes gene_type:complete
MPENILPPIEELPVLPHMNTTMKFDLAFSHEGEVYVFHDKAFSERINWAEYDSKEAQLYFVAENGRIQNLGLKIFKDMQKIIMQARRIFIIYVENGVQKQIIEMPLLIQLN